MHLYKSTLLFSAIFLFLALFAEAQNDMGSSKVTRSAELKKDPDIFGKVIRTIPQDSLIDLYDKYSERYIMASFKGDTGYVMQVVLDNNDLVNKIIYDGRNPQLAQLEEKFSSRIAQKIHQNQVWVGMTTAMLLASWGSPRDKHKTVTTYSVREQWIYGEYPNRKYIYLEDGEVTTIQK